MYLALLQTKGLGFESRGVACQLHCIRSRSGKRIIIALEHWRRVALTVAFRSEPLSYLHTEFSETTHFNHHQTYVAGNLLPSLHSPSRTTLVPYHTNIPMTDALFRSNKGHPQALVAGDASKEPILDFLPSILKALTLSLAL